MQPKRAKISVTRFSDFLLEQCMHAIAEYTSLLSVL